MEDRLRIINTSIKISIITIFIIACIVIVLASCGKKEDALRDESEIALEVLEGHWGVGKDISYNLKNAGYDINKVIKHIDNFKVSEPSYKKPKTTEEITEPETIIIYEEYNNELQYGEYTPYDLMYQGVIYWGNWRFTWYSENVLPGGGLAIPGRTSDGNFVRDVNGYICCASSDLPRGSVVETPWGTACVYDCGCASGTIDIYTSW